MYQRQVTCVTFFFICIVVIVLELCYVNAGCCRNRISVAHPCGTFATERRQKIKANKLRCSSLICLDGHIVGAFFCSLGDCDITGCNCDEPCITNERGSWKDAKKLFSDFYEVPALN